MRCGGQGTELRWQIPGLSPYLMTGDKWFYVTVLSVKCPRIPALMMMAPTSQTSRKKSSVRAVVSHLPHAPRATRKAAALAGPYVNNRLVLSLY